MSRTKFRPTFESLEKREVFSGISPLASPVELVGGEVAGQVAESYYDGGEMTESPAINLMPTTKSALAVSAADTNSDGTADIVSASAGRFASTTPDTEMSPDRAQGFLKVPDVIGDSTDAALGQGNESVNPQPSVVAANFIGTNLRSSSPTDVGANSPSHVLLGESGQDWFFITPDGSLYRMSSTVGMETFSINFTTAGASTAEVAAGDTNGDSVDDVVTTPRQLLFGGLGQDFFKLPDGSARSVTTSEPDAQHMAHDAVFEQWANVSGDLMPPTPDQIIAILIG